jgi:hypothetical protein
MPLAVDAGDLAEQYLGVALLRCRRTKLRMGQAISAGNRPAVATW